jgi:transcriptional regulator with XRE-family HTH domain
MATSSDAESRRLAELLTLLVRFSGRSHRALEEELGFGSAFLSKILRGNVRLQASHIIRICEVLGVEPYYFFKIAYPRAKKPPGPLILQTRVSLGLEAMDDEDAVLEEKIKRVLRKLLKEETTAEL